MKFNGIKDLVFHIVDNQLHPNDESCQQQQTDLMIALDSTKLPLLSMSNKVKRNQITAHEKPISCCCHLCSTQQDASHVHDLFGCVEKEEWCTTSLRHSAISADF